MIINKDCLDVMKEFKSDLIDMIYLDPPFFTQKKHTLSDSNGKEYCFTDSWESIDEYLKYMEERIYEMYRILKPNGNLFLHGTVKNFV